MNKLTLAFVLLAAPAAAELTTVYDDPPVVAPVPVSTATVAALDDHSKKLDNLDTRVQILENTAPASPAYVRVGSMTKRNPLSAPAKALADSILLPQVDERLARINSGQVHFEDIAFVIAAYNTTVDRPALEKFCAQLLSGKIKFDATGARGLRLWLSDQCE